MTVARQRRLAAVWFADIVGYTALASKNEDAALRTVDAFQRVAREVVEADRGQLVKFLGDGGLAAFETAGAAVRAAARLREAYASAAREAALPAELRIGVHLGEIVTAEDGDVYGDGVNVASRLQAVAEPGEILASEDVWRQLRRREGFALEPAGEKDLKGIADPMPAYRVTEVAGAAGAREPESVGRPAGEESAPEPLPEPAPSGATTPSHRRRMVSFLGIGALVALVAVGASTWFLGKGGGGVSEASVAVLPFQNLSGEAENEYFSDGITDDILTALSKVGGLKVISRTSTLQYKGTTKPIKEIADELDVATILEGTVRRSGDQVRITAQLINARTDEHLWAETYDRELTDVFAIQSEIAAEIADRLHVALSQRETASIRAGETSVPEAYDLVLRAGERLGDRDKGQISRSQSAIEMLRQALELDPRYARAHATLGLAYANLVIADNRSWADSALAASRRAIELAPELATGYTALGSTQFALGLSGEALASFRRAIELDPNNVDARGGAADVLDELNRWDEVLDVLLPAVRADPGGERRYVWVADMYSTLGLPDLADTWLAEAERRGADPAGIHIRRALWAFYGGDLDRAEAEVGEAGPPDFGRPGMISVATWIALSRGRYDEARRIVEIVNRMSSFEFSWIIIPGYIEWKTGNREEAGVLFQEGERRSRKVMAESPEVSESYVDLARIASTRGDLDGAMSWLEQAYEHGRRAFRLLRTDPMLENVRADPRFEPLMRRMEADVAAMRERAPKEMP